MAIFGFLFGAGFAWAIMPMVAAFSARDDEVQVRRATRMALWWSAIYVAASLPLFWYSGALLRLMGQEPRIADLAQDYLRLAAIGLAPALGVMVLKNYLAGLEHTRIVLYITLAAAVANALANYALIFGNWGAPELGIKGAAVASVLSHLTALLFVILYAVRVLPQHQLFVRFWRPDWEMFSRVARIGIPIGVTTLAEASLFASSAILMGLVGVIPLAAHGIAMTITSGTFMIHMGLSNAATVRAGAAYGRGDVVALDLGARAVLILGTGAVVLTILAFLSVPDALVGAFVDANEPERDAILAVGRQLLMMAALFQFADAAQVLYLGFLRGLQDTRVPMLIAALSYWGVGFPAAYILGITYGYDGIGVWGGMTIGLTVVSVLLAWRFWRQALPGVARAA